MNYFILGVTLLWSLFLYYVLRAQKALKSLDDLRTDLADVPRISIILAVKDGEKDLPATLDRLVNENVEIIIVNDRSTDRTASIIREYQEKFPNILFHEVTELPKGWLGKVHALHQGTKLATGDYLLFMDADIRISGATLEKALSICQQMNLDHLAVLPDTKRGEFLLNLMMCTSKFLFTWSARTWLSIEKRPLKSVKGVGAFNLVRKSAFDKTEGFTWLKMDVADDVALALLIAKHGGRSLILKAGKEGPYLDWYKDFYDLVKGLEKNVVGGFTNYKPSLVFFMSFFAILILILHMIPAVVLTTLIFAMLVKKHTKFSFMEVFAFPLGITLLGCILIRASRICFRNGGIRWSGSFYPLKDLKEGSRVKLGP